MAEDVTRLLDELEQATIGWREHGSGAARAVYAAARARVETVLLGDQGGAREALDLAQAQQCPLCGHQVAQWRLEHGTKDHEPGE